MSGISGKILQIYYGLPVFIKNAIASVHGLKLVVQRNKNRHVNTKEILKFEHLSCEEVETWQKNKLREILIHAYQTVPFYKNFWNDRLSANANLEIENLHNWPIITKENIRESPELFISNQFKDKKVIIRNSSGTSGKPMNYVLSKETFSYWYAMYDRRIKEWNGVNSKTRWANIGGQLIVSQSKTKPPYWVWNSSMNQLYLSSYHIKSENIVFYIEALKKYQVEYLLGYVSSLYNIAFLANELGLKAPDLKLIITNAEPLFDHQRHFMKEFYKCPVVQTYSGNEFAFGGNEGPDGNLYLWPEAGIVETINEKGNFVSPEIGGELIATGLLNFAMPLIRFKIGDNIKLKSADSNRTYGFQVVDEITGRTDDLIKTKDGRIIGRLDPIFKTNLKIKEAQIIQHALDSLEIKIVPANNYSVLDENLIIDRTKDRVGKDMNVSISLVDSIPRGPNGKFKAVISKVKR